MGQMEIDPNRALKDYSTSSSFLQVYYEAVANALDAEATEIYIVTSVDSKTRSEDLEITIKDNGKGLTAERFERFRKITDPVDRYHKGVGRLVYLNYFNTIEVESIYSSKKRAFTYSVSFNGIAPESEASDLDPHGTILRFNGFRRDRLRSNEDINPVILGNKIIEQFLPRLNHMKKEGKEFKIELRLIIRNQTELVPDAYIITPAAIPPFDCKELKDISLGAFSKILMHYIVKPKSGERQVIVAACVDGRTISIPLTKLLNQNSIPLNYSVIFLFESDLFNGQSDNARQQIVLSEGMYRFLRQQMSAVLNENLSEVKEKNTESKRHFEDRYPHLTGYFEDDTVGLIDRDEAIDMAQHRFFRDQKVILECDSLDDPTFDKALEVSSRTLTEYILYRELIIKKFGAITEANVEEYGHDLIVPRHKRFDKTKMLDGIYSNNAWLLDDKFMTFQTILSEKTMDDLIQEITGSDDVKSGGRPDISMVFSGDPHSVDKTKVDVVVVEIKRRNDDDEANTYATVQLTKRARKLIDHCPNIQRVWYFAIVEINDELNQILLDSKWTPIFSKGRVFYQDFQLKRADGITVPTPICILSYNALIQDAAARNHTFLELLKHAFKTKTAPVSTETEVARVASEHKSTTTTTKEARRKSERVPHRDERTSKAAARDGVKT